jgi:hypothetical protein
MVMSGGRRRWNQDFVDAAVQRSECAHVYDERHYGGERRPTAADQWRSPCSTARATLAARLLRCSALLFATRCSPRQWCGTSQFRVSALFAMRMSARELAGGRPFFPERTQLSRKSFVYNRGGRAKKSVSGVSESGGLPICGDGVAQHFFLRIEAISRHTREARTAGSRPESTMGVLRQRVGRAVGPFVFNWVLPALDCEGLRSV